MNQSTNQYNQTNLQWIIDWQNNLGDVNWWIKNNKGSRWGPPLNPVSFLHCFTVREKNGFPSEKFILLEKLKHFYVQLM